MQKVLNQKNFQGKYNIDICGSKSESNRLLILKKLFPELIINNLSTSDDTKVLEKALNNDEELIDIHHAGTAMRFLTAYYAFYSHKTIELTGSERMQNRPVKILVDALKSLGAKIEYAAKEGFPPLIIKPAKINKNKVELKADVSSQYVSSLMLSASKLPNGLTIKFTSQVTSLPYIEMTVQFMRKLGIKVDFTNEGIVVHPASKITFHDIDVESDWSSASYFYSTLALSPDLKLNLSTYNKNSLQGDSKLSEIYKILGVNTTYHNNSILLENNKKVATDFLELDLIDTPDLAQTIAVTCLGLNLPCKLSGLHTLKIKETDRLVAMKKELEKFGAHIKIDNQSLAINPPKSLSSGQLIDTYNDHRMAMAFAPLCSKTNLTINDAEVVSKSYPAFWKDFDNFMQ
jgi:3-phosphoshikimate 1-carboxyvinyltransferase